MSFGDDIRRYAQAQKRVLRDVAIESLVDLTSSVIVQTPVDTGVLANNWQPTTTEPARGVVVDADDSTQMSDAERAIAASIGGVYYLVNNLEYARPIEFLGTSLKAPRGMLRISIENYKNMLNNSIDKNQT